MAFVLCYKSLAQNKRHHCGQVIYNVSLMNKLSIDQLNQLKLSIFDNAEKLYDEAKLLNENGMHARAYLLAYFSCEELGKLPIIVGALGNLVQGKEVNWKKVNKRFYSHKEKVISENHHHYVFGIEPDVENNSDVKWLNEQNEKSHSKVNYKNKSTYVDVVNGEVMLPSEQITEQDAKQMIDRAFSSLSAHWKSELISNPILVKANNANQH